MRVCYRGISSFIGTKATATINQIADSTAKVSEVVLSQAVENAIRTMKIVEDQFNVAHPNKNCEISSTVNVGPFSVTLSIHHQSKQ